jgi:hypothetical protein
MLELLSILLSKSAIIISTLDHRIDELPKKPEQAHTVSIINILSLHVIMIVPLIYYLLTYSGPACIQYN